MKQKQTLLLGAHTSIAGGLYKAIERGESIGCSTIQIFTKSNRQWFGKPLKEEEIDIFKQAWSKSYIDPVVAHAGYLINIASPKKEVAALSKKSLMQELNRCEQLGIPSLVLHPGSHVDTDEQAALERIAHSLDAVLEAVPGKTAILLETMAGQGSMLGHTLEQLAQIYSTANTKQRLGFCMDTCHVFAAGYTMNTKEAYETFWRSFDNLLGIDLLKLIHVNDSKSTLGSHVDRHEDIGKGKIGLEAFRLLFNDSRFFGVPKILETPKESLEDDFRNMKIIESLLSKKTKGVLEIKLPESAEL